MTSAVSPTVSRVLKGSLCSGCGLCASLSDGAIRMDDASSGFLRPRQVGALNRNAEAVIADACPGAVVAPWPEAPHSHPVWGPWRKIATGHATDEQVRFKGSSGGAVSALLIHALRSGQVDRVVHVAADPDDPPGNIVTVSRSEAEIIRGAGSRYASSSPLADIEAALAEGGAFAFVGKPCDVSALRRLALHDPRVDKCVPLMLSFFCGGVPGRKGVRSILAVMGLKEEELASFRYRGHGWPGDAVAVARDGRTEKMSYADSWGVHLTREVQFRCKICPDAVGGVADVSCADAWYGDERGYPVFEDQPGRSLVLARTIAGERLLEAAVLAGVLAAAPVGLDEVGGMQAWQAIRKGLVRARQITLALMMQPKPRSRGTRLRDASRSVSKRLALWNVVGMARRVLAGRR
jgi:coenzyme F420 hydrogenase subunit beta